MPTHPAQQILPLEDAERAAHLLNRAAFGPMPGDVDRILKLGIEVYLDQQVHPETIDDSEIDRWDSVFITLTVEPGGLKLPPAVAAPARALNAAVLPELQCYKLMRAIHSKRQLQEVMVDFWFNHFNVFWNKGDVRHLTTAYERTAIRPNVFAKFKELLLAVAKHPAMLVYLDNALSTASGINENYARELMELHTLGVDGGYTQKDVEEVARCFTGWTVHSETLQFHFDAAQHAPGPKTVLGNIIPESGQAEGEAVIALLASHPSTARFITKKLVRRLVSDEPPQALVDKVGKAFVDTDGDLRATVRAILLSDEFFAPQHYRAKIKSPFEYVVSAVRALDVEVRVPASRQPLLVFETPLGQAAVRLQQLGYVFQRFQLGGISQDIQAYMSLAQPLESMGQFIYRYEAPTGVPDRADYWINAVTVLNRMNFALALAENEVPGMYVDTAKLEKLAPGQATATNKWQATFELLSGAPGGRLVHVQPPAASGPDSPFGVILGLVLGSPEFQHR